MYQVVDIGLKHSMDGIELDLSRTISNGIL